MFGASTAEAVKAVQRMAGLPITGEVDKATHAALTNPATAPRAVGKASVKPVEVDKPPVVVSGRIYLERGEHAAGVKLRFYQHEFGGTATMLKETVTAADGKFDVDWGKDGPPSNVEVRAVGPDRSETALTGAIRRIVGELNLVAPQEVQGQVAEYLSLHHDLKAHVPEGKLGKAAAGDVALEPSASLCRHKPTGHPSPTRCGQLDESVIRDERLKFETPDRESYEVCPGGTDAAPSLLT